MRVRYSFSSRRTGKIESTNQHRQPFPKIAKEVIRVSDIVLEILDARFIEKTRNLELETLVKASGKILIYVLNKADLVNTSELKKQAESMNLYPYVVFSCKSHAGRKDLRDRIKIELKRFKINDSFKKAHVGVIGYPNTGKSSLINLLTGRGAAKRSAEAGFTKGVQKIRLNKDILILDTPGVIPEGENSAIIGKDLKKHAEISVRTYDKVKHPEFIVAELMKENPGIFERYYKIDAKGDSEIFLDILGRRKHLLRKGNEVDLDRTARIVLKEWQLGKIKKQNSY